MNQPMQGTRTKGRNPRYRVVQIKDGTAILETDVEREAVRAALAHNRKADDHLGVVYRGRFLKIA